MAVPAWVAAGTASIDASTATPGLPTGWQENDILLLFVEDIGGAAPSAPTGYAAVADSPQETDAGAQSGQTRLSVFWKRATSSESGPSVAGNGNHVYAVMGAVRDCVATGDPWDVTSGGVDETVTTSFAATGDTTTGSDRLVVVVGSVSTDTDTPQFSSWANSDLASVTERINIASSQRNGGGIGVATGEKATAGSYGNTTATLGAASQFAFLTVALKGAEEAGEPVSGDAALSAPAAEIAVSASLGFRGDAAFSASAAQTAVSGSLAFRGDAAVAAPSAEVESSGKLAFRAEVAFSAPAAEISGNDGTASSVSGDADVTAPSAQIGASARLTFSATGAVSAPAGQVASSGDLGFSGSVAIESPAGTVAATGKLAFPAAVAIESPAATLGSSGKLAFSGSISFSASSAEISGSEGDVGGEVELEIVVTAEMTGSLGVPEAAVSITNVHHVEVTVA